MPSKQIHGNPLTPPDPRPRSRAPAHISLAVGQQTVPPIFIEEVPQMSMDRRHQPAKGKTLFCSSLAYKQVYTPGLFILKGVLRIHHLLKSLPWRKRAGERTCVGDMETRFFPFPCRLEAMGKAESGWSCFPARISLVPCLHGSSSSGIISVQ